MRHRQQFIKIVGNNFLLLFSMTGWHEHKQWMEDRDIINDISSELIAVALIIKLLTTILGLFGAQSSKPNDRGVS